MTIHRQLLALLATALIMPAACREEAKKPLAELAAKVAEPAAEAQPERSSDLLTVYSTDPRKLVARLHTPALLLLDNETGARLSQVIEELKVPEKVYLEVREFLFDIDLETRSPVVSRLDARLLLRPAAGLGVADEASRWSKLLARLPLAVGDGAEPRCAPRGELVVCGVGNQQSEAKTEAFVARWGLLQGQGSPLFLVRMGLRQMVDLMEKTVGSTFFWAVFPEEFLRFESLELTLTETPDRLALSLVARNSGVLDGLHTFFLPPDREVRLPERTPAVGFASIHEAKATAEKLDGYWKAKWAAAPGLRLKKALDDTWRTQLLELASGIVGIAVVGKISMTKPGTAFVYLFQPTDPKLFEKRMAHIFSSKYFRLEKQELRTGEEVTRVERRGRKKKGANKERLAWFLKDGTYYIAAASNTLRLLAEDMHARPGVDKPFMRLTLQSPGRASARVSVPAILRRIVLPDDAGLGMGMALTMLKNSAKEIDRDIIVNLLLDPPGEEGEQTLTVQVDNLFFAVDVLMKELGPLMRVTAR